MRFLASSGLLPALAVLLFTVLASPATPVMAQGLAACHDACDAAGMRCDRDETNCFAIRESCLRRCDADPRKLSPATRMRVQETEEEWRARMTPNDLPKLSGCQIRCEESARTCKQDNPDAAFCETAETSCIDRCEKKRRR